MQLSTVRFVETTEAPFNVREVEMSLTRYEFFQVYVDRERELTYNIQPRSNFQATRKELTAQRPRSSSQQALLPQFLARANPFRTAKSLGDFEGRFNF